MTSKGMKGQGTTTTVVGWGPSSAVVSCEQFGAVPTTITRAYEVYKNVAAENSVAVTRDSSSDGSQKAGDSDEDGGLANHNGR